MDITIEERVIGRVTVLDIVGRLTIDRGAERLRDKVNSLIAQERTGILLNLQDVPYIDSGGLGQLVASYRIGCEEGGQLETARRQLAESRPPFDYAPGHAVRIVRLGD